MKRKINSLNIFKKKYPHKRIPLSVGIELTSRCNLNCRHCYINKPLSDQAAKSLELTLDEIDRITDDALRLGTLWIQLSGGEPLIRDDFIEIYLLLKKKGFLVSVLTNATLIRAKHVEVFKKYPPRNLEISIYGASKKTLEYVTQTKGSLSFFQKGLNLSIDNGFSIILKTIATNPVVPEHDQIRKFAERYKNVTLSIDKQIISRTDRDPGKNAIIRTQIPENVILPDKDKCQLSQEVSKTENEFGGNLFFCNAGKSSCRIGSDGAVHLCTTLRNPELAYDLRQGSFQEYWTKKVPGILSLRSDSPDYKANCGNCAKKSECRWCPAWSWVETGCMDKKIDRICLMSVTTQ